MELRTPGALQGGPSRHSPHTVGLPPAPTFAVGDTGGAVEVGAAAPWAGDAVVLAELRLVGADRAAHAAVGGGVVVVAGGAVHCGAGGHWRGHSPRGLSRVKAFPHCLVPCHPRLVPLSPPCPQPCSALGLGV